MSQAYEKNMYVQARRNVIRTWVIIGLFFGVVLGIGYAFAVLYQDVSLVAIAVVFALLTNLSSYFYSERIALSVSGARRADPTNPEHLRLIRLVENVSITAGLPTPKVHIIDDPAPNAFATGRNHTHASVAFTTGILEVLNDSELEGVVAHEISHIKSRDILVGTIVIIMVGFIALLSELFLRSGMGRDSRSQDGRVAAIMFLAVIVFAILAPLVAKLIQLAVSRRREYLADANAVLLTRYPEGLAGALATISGRHAPLERSSEATSHLFIANPFGAKGSVKNFVGNLFSTHPPMDKRIEALVGEEMKNQLVAPL